MKILAIDSSGLVASVAVLADDAMVAEYTVNYKKTHSQTLLPMIDEIARMIELDLETVDAIAVAGGPGSFTGLRIGSATAKGLGLAADKPLVPVPTVDALAMNCCGASGYVAPMMDARRDQIYCGIYHFAEDGVTLVTDLAQAPRSIGEFAEAVNATGGPVTLLGDGLTAHMEAFPGMLDVPYRIAPPHMARQRAGAVATLAAQYYREGRTVTAGEHAPEYLRKSQAEREREAAEKEKRGQEAKKDA